jgi:DNA-directed RNA polymerase subunit RPC12/RpoP
MPEKCLGPSTLREATTETRKCPACGEEVEIFSDEQQARCSNCGCTVYKA